MNLNSLSIKELCFLYLQEYLDNKYSQSFDIDDSKYLKELKSRINVDINSFDEFVKEAQSNNLISKEEYEEIFTAIKIKEITSKALDKLKKNK